METTDRLKKDMSPSGRELQDRLDSLWTDYLRQLDSYTAAQNALQKHFRAGFFSLSRANFKARPGMRYGKDYYHDRATATKRARPAGEDGRPALAIGTKAVSTKEEPEHKTAAAEGKADVAVPQQQPSPPTTPAPEDDKQETDKSEPKNDEDSASETESTAAAATPQTSRQPLEADPLRWYGILVPRELRSAQVSFSSAFDECIADAVNSGRALREIEVGIRKLRKEIRRAEKAQKT